jgi:hypothetical protein
MNTDLEGEVWKEVERYPGYFVSNKGRWKSFRRFHWGRIQKGHLGTDGYIVVRPYFSYYCSKLEFLHVLVAETFLGPRPSPNHVANHKDGHKDNNPIENLEWLTKKEDIAHAIRSGLARPGPEKGWRGQSRGSQHYSTLASNDTVANIKRDLLGFDALGIQRGYAFDLAKKYNVSIEMIHKIHQGKVWKHIDPASKVETEKKDDPPML